ncbi:MAG: hypothetical protein JOZ18_08695 [Chloroflexi bacterium]|nr:hypothetical protein [Chloroflexota bacterium]
MADRFHLLKNVRESLKDLLDHKRCCLPFREAGAAVNAAGAGEPSYQREAVSRLDGTVQPSEPAMLLTPSAIEEEPPSDQLSVAERSRQVNREKRYALYEEVWHLRKQGFSHYAIANALGISRPTVRRFLASEQFPERLSGPRARRKSILAPYLPFLQQR